LTLDQKLLLYAQQFEDQNAPENITTTLREASAEIERLRAALERAADSFFDVGMTEEWAEARAALANDVRTTAQPVEGEK
jgi:hypothetical protein